MVPQTSYFLVSDCGCDYRARSKALQAVMATSGMTTMRDYVEFKITGKNMYVKSNKYFVLFAIQMLTLRYLLYSSSLYF